jgi:hypothetical protein
LLGGIHPNYRIITGEKKREAKNGIQYHYSLYRKISVEISVENFWFVFVRTCTGIFAYKSQYESEYGC